MIKLKIDGKEISVAEGTTVLKAARELGISIPTMCFYKDELGNHPSCMICLVKDNANGKLQPSCALPAAEGMNITTMDNEIFEARKEALELLLSDHVGDCEAPCQLGCPANMNIPLMNRLIAKGDFKKAIEVVKEEIALPYILGYICPAPCEKVCRRATIDSSVQICQLKKFVATDVEKEAFFPEKEKASGKKVAVIGSGPAGLSAAFFLLKNGHECVLFEKNEQAGGSLRYEELDKDLPFEVLDAEINYLKKYGACFELNTKVDQDKFNQIQNDFDAIVLSTGILNFEIKGLDRTEEGIRANAETFETSIPGVFVCGSAIRSLKMAVRSVAQGKATALAVNAYLKGEAIKTQSQAFNSKFGKLMEADFEAYLKEAPNAKVEKTTYTELNPFSAELAQKEAGRCMHCDCRKIDSCALRIHSTTYNVDRRKYLMGERKPVTKDFKQDIIVFEPEKCIKCGTCVEITAQHKEEFGLTHIGRGFEVKIKAPFAKVISDALTLTAIECATACPTAAISLIEK